MTILLNQTENNDEFSDNDYLYDVCNNEERPSKEGTTNNTGLTTLREDSNTLQPEI